MPWREYALERALVFFKAFYYKIKISHRFHNLTQHKQKQIEVHVESILFFKENFHSRDRMSAGRTRVRPGNYSQIRIRKRKLPPLAPSKNEDRAPSVRQRAQSVPCNASARKEQLVPGGRVRSEGFIALSVSASSIYVCMCTHPNYRSSGQK